MQSAEKEVEAALTLEGALLIADAAVYDHGNLERIALKTLAHSFRCMRAKADQHERQSEIIRRMTEWLEKNQPDVFRRGIWEAING